MTDIFLPAVRLAKVSPRLIDRTGRFVSALSGATRTVGRPGDRWGFRLDYSNLLGFDRARLESFIARQRGAANRVLWSPTIEYPQRGSFPSAELFTNNDFSNGTTGWTGGLGVGANISAQDNRLRITFNGGGQLSVHQSLTSMTANVPFVARYFFVDGLGGPLAAQEAVSYIEGTNVSSHVVSVEGLTTVSMVVDTAAGAQYIAWGNGGGGVPAAGPGALAGNYYDCVWCSMSQCFLVDNAPNQLQFSDTLASPWASAAASATVNAAVAADGTTSATAIVDTTTNTAHYFNQSYTASGAAGLDYMVCGEVKQAAQGFAFFEISESVGGTGAYIIINLATGALGTPGVGTNWANARGYVVNMGNGWFYFAVIARKTNNATTVSAIVGPAGSIGTLSYAGAGTAAVYVRRITSSQSSSPALQVQSGNAAVAPVAQTGSAINVKGLYPLGTQALLLAGDWIEVNKELKRLTAQLDSDAAGRGWLQFSPPIRTSPNDNDPVIVNKPMGRFIFSGQETGWSTVPGYFATAAVDLQESGS